ncbi:MAG: hypothetical protein AAGJ37_11750 [Pseudomonadota bacterium]
MAFDKSLIATLSAFCALSIIHIGASAQDATVTDDAELAESNAHLIADAKPTVARSVSSGPIIRLEDTIRGNKEQPQVLTIVPWQLPVHKNIDATSKWQPAIDKLAPIERNTLLRNLDVFAVVEDSDTVAEE